MIDCTICAVLNAHNIKEPARNLVHQLLQLELQSHDIMDHADEQAIDLPGPEVFERLMDDIYDMMGSVEEDRVVN